MITCVVHCAIAAACIRDEGRCVLCSERSFMHPFIGADK
jgi:hypothetical protein